MNQDEIQFGKLALQKKLIDSEILAKCLEIKKSQGISLMDAMAHGGYLTQNQVADICASGNLALVQSLGKYKIIKEIGRGGMGRIYKAMDTTSSRIVALKLIDDRSSANNPRILREAKATARLNHPNIVTLYEVGEEQGQHFFSMEYIEGKSIEDFIKSDSLSIRKMVGIMVQIVEAMQYAHDHGVIHRDIKPDNIMLDKNEEPQILDFGLAKLEDVSQSLTVSGTLIGTVFYMPPEQAEGRISAIDARSDVYALGGVLYMMLTGRPPFMGNNFSQVLKQILNKDPLAPSSIKNIVPKSLDAICLKALAKKKNQRYQSAVEMQLDLQKFLDGAKISGVGLRWKQKTTNWLSKNVIFLFVYFVSLMVLSIIFYDSYQVLQKANKSKQFTITKLNKEKKELEVINKRAEGHYQKAFHYYTHNDHEKGWKEILQACAIKKEKRYMVLKGFYYSLAPNWDKEKAKEIILKNLPQFEEADATTCHIVGRIYRKGVLGKQQIDLALKWFQRGERLGSIPCIESQGETYFNYPLIKDRKKAFTFFQRSAGKYHWASYCYAHAHRLGAGVKKDIAIAIKWYKKAAVKGNATAMNELGHIHRKGLTGKIDYKKALEWYNKAATQREYPGAFYWLAIMHYKGFGVKKDINQALFLANKAAEKQHKNSVKFLINRYKELKYYASVWVWLKKYNANNAYAMYTTGQMYEHGWGIEKDLEQAQLWYKKASDNDNAIARERLQSWKQF